MKSWNLWTNTDNRLATPPSPPELYIMSEMKKFIFIWKTNNRHDKQSPNMWGHQIVRRNVHIFRNHSTVLYSWHTQTLLCFSTMNMLVAIICCRYVDRADYWYLIVSHRIDISSLSMHNKNWFLFNKQICVSLVSLSRSCRHVIVSTISLLSPHAELLPHSVSLW